MSAPYAPPSHPPPPSPSASSPSPSGAPSHNYAPTSTPTPGQPLLRNGKMLVYPHGWRGCPKCQDTGYKQGDPSHPCRKCWQDYGKPFNPLLISSAGLQGAKVLQRPLAAWQAPGGFGMPGQYPLPGRMHSQAPSGYAGYPGASSLSPQATGSSNTFLSHQHTGATAAYAPFAPQSTGGSAPFGGVQSIGSTYAPPVGAPPPDLPPRRADPPRVNRADESREDDLNEQGEAPPAYEDAVAAGPDGAAPPQRTEEHRITTTTTIQSNASTPHHPSPHVSSPGPIYPHPLAPSQQQYRPYHQAADAHGSWGSGMGFGPGGGPQPHFVQYGHAPPPQALVVRPGDPRIGGRLCHKCGGDGVREGFWFGDQDTCWHCNGTGRIL